MKRKEKKAVSNKVIRGFVLSCGLAFVGLGIGLYSQNQLIQAKPDDGANTPIVVDRGTAEEYQLPYDATSLIEPTLQSDTAYANYIQNSGYKMNAFKKYVNGFSTTRFDRGSVGAVLADGSTLNMESSGGYPIIENAAYYGNIDIVKRDKNGNELKRITVYDLTTGMPRVERTQTTFFNNGDGTYSLYYTGVTSASVGGGQFITFDNNLNNVVRKKLDITYLAGLTEVYRQTPSRGKLYISPRTTPSNSTDGNATFYVVDQLSLKHEKTLKLEFPASVPKPVNWVSDNLIYDKGTYYAGNLVIQSLSGAGSYLYFVTWDKTTGKITNIYKPTEDWQDIEIFDLEPESNDIYFRYTRGATDRTEINKVTNNGLSIDLASKVVDPNSTDINKKYGSSFPPQTYISLKKRTDGYVFLGTMNHRTDYFADLVGDRGAVVGFLKPSFEFENASMLEGSTLSIGLNEQQGNEMYIGGGFSNTALDFLTNQITIPTKINAAWNGTSSVSSGLTGRLDIARDYAPVINKQNSIQINLDDLNTSNKDKWLLEGMNSTSIYNVYDSKDSNEATIEGKPGQDWLNARINRNPNAPTNPIDWEALGFEDNGKIGPNRVTYFVTDSQKQTTSTSRIVNKIDSHTVLNKKGALGAYNFGIKLADVGNLTDASLRDPSAYAQLMAWDLDDETVDVLSLPAAQGVEINSTQLDTIRNATEFGVFDLTFTLNYGDEPKEVTIKVFVSEDGPVEGFSYDVRENKIPWDISRNITGEAYPNSEYAKIQAYKISTGEKIDKNNTSYQIKAEVGALNAADPNPADYTATQAVKVPLAIYKTNGSQPEATFKTIPDTTVYYRVEDIKIAFTDWNFGTLYDVDGNTLQAAGVELKNQIVGKTTAIKTNQEVVDAIDVISLKGYEKEKFYLSDKQTELTVDGLEIVFNDGKGYQYYLRFKGLLELVSVPSKIDFGQGESTLGTMRKNDPTVTGSLVISDTRADTTKNWTLKAELSKPMTSLSGNTVIPDAIRYKRSGQAEFILDANKQVMLANNAGTFGTFNVSDTWGTGKDDDGFKFEAQAVKVHEIGKYQATIKYTLSDTYEP